MLTPEDFADLVRRAEPLSERSKSDRPLVEILRVAASDHQTRTAQAVGEYFKQLLDKIDTERKLQAEEGHWPFN